LIATNFFEGNFALLIVIGVFIFLLIVGSIYFFVELIRIEKLFKQNRFKKCKRAIKRVNFFLTSKKYNQGMYSYLGAINFAEGNTAEALRYLEKINLSKLLEIRYFWECAIFLSDDVFDIAKEKYKMFLSTNPKIEINAYILNCIFAVHDDINKMTLETLKSVMSKITHPKILEYCQGLLEKNKILSETSEELSPETEKK